MAASVASLSAADLSRPQMFAAPTSPTHPCRVRIPGPRSLYRNDPYGCTVLPSLPSAAPAFETHAHFPRSSLPTLPPAFQMASRTATRVKAEIARAATYSTNDFADTPSQDLQSALLFDSPTAADACGWALVRLKHEVLLYQCGFPVAVGDFVVMQGDRGENIGRVQQLIAEQPVHHVTCSILRFASSVDMEGLDEQRRREEAAKNFAQGVADALQLRIVIVDTEFQSDGNKLTVYFSSRRMIDFRQLQRQLFKQYRCRIWLVNWNDVIKA